MTMSPKELLYIDDALSHEEQMKKCCADFASQLQDPNLQNFVNKMAESHKENFCKLYNLL